MKKTIIALAVLAAGSASAAQVYDKDGVAVDVHGAVEIQLYQGYEFTGQTVDKDVRLDDGNLNFTTTVEINEDLKALAYFDFDFEDGNHTNSDLWAGLETNFGTIKAGRMLTNWDDTGIDKSYEVGLTDLNEVSTYTEGEDVIRYDINMGNINASIATNLNTAGKENGASHTDMQVGFTADALTLRAFYQTSETDMIVVDGKDYFDVDGTAYALEAEFNKDGLGLATGYYVSELENSQRKVGYETIELAASYKIEATTIAGGVNLVDGTDDIDKGKVTNYYVTVTQSLHKNVRVYGEVGFADIESIEDGLSDDAVSYLAGMEVSF